MDAELQFHLDARAHDLIASGLSPDPARRRAREELGDARKWKEAGREARGLRALDALRTDVRQGLWQFRRSPAFAAAAVVSMAIAIGANTAVFSLVNAVVIKRLPVEDPGALVLLGVSSDTQALGSSFPYPFYQELRQATDVMRGVLASASMTPSLEAGDSVERVPGELVSGNYFDVLGVTPYAGRLIVERDEALHAPVVVLDYGYWQRRFGGDPAIVGRTIRLNQMPLTVIGITPPAFHGIEPGGAPKLRVPITLQPLMHGGESFLGLSGQWWLQIIGRVRPDISRAQLTDVLGRDYARYRAQQPDARDLPERLELLDGSQGRPTLRRQFQQPLAILTALVAVVLILVCVNVGSLMLARATTRQREMALRLALGAGRIRVMRQLVVEALVLAAAGGVIGLGVAYWGAHAMTLLAGAPPDFSVPLDFRVLGFASVITLLTGVLAGLAPAWASRRADLLTTLKVDTAQVARGRAAGRRFLVAAQIALSLAVVVGAGLFARTLFNLRHADLGFDGDRLALVTVNPVLAGYTKERLRPFYDDVLQRVAKLPSVEAAAFARMPLLAGDVWGSGLTLDTGEKDDAPGPTRNAIGPGFLRTLGVPLREGREFTAADTQMAEPVALVNEAFVRRYFHDAPALGRRIGPGGPNGKARYTIVGVTRDSRLAEVRAAVTPFWYVPYAQLSNVDQLILHVRATGAPEDALADVRAVVAAVDKTVPLMEAATIRQNIEDQVLAERLMMVLASAFAVFTILLAWIGLYSVMSYLTTARARELSIRMALGATPSSVLRLMLGQSAVVICGGVLGGIVLAWLGSQQVRALLFDLEPTDRVTMLGAAAVVLIVTTIAATLPARRAANTDPASSLR